MKPKREKDRTPCEPAKHNYVEATKLVLWKGQRRILIFCTQCGQTDFVGSIDEAASQETPK